MFHPIFLQFNYEVLEKEYMNEQKDKIRYDFTLYFIFAEFIVGMLAASNISSKTYQLALVNILLMIFLILSFIIIRKGPFYLKLILPILQISYCLNFRFQLQLENLSKIDTYIQGSISQFLTFATLFQGQHMKCSLILIPTAITYITMLENFNFDQYVCIAQFLFAYIGMVMLKYNMERSNRIAFLEARENQKWISLMENSVNNNVIFIFNRKRVQLDFSIATNQLMKEFFLRDTDDIKQLIRNFNIKSSPKIQTLEEYVLEQLQQFKKFKDIEDVPIVYKPNNQVYKVKIMYIFNRGQQKILFRIQQDQKKIDPKKEASLLLMNQRRIIKYMSKQLAEIYYIKFTQSLTAKSFNLLIQMSMIQCTLNKNYYNHIMQTRIIEVEQYCFEAYKCIKKIYNGFSFKVLLQGNQYLNISESGLTFLLVTIIQIFTKSDKGNITLKVSGLQYGLINFKLEINNYNLKAAKVQSLLQLNELYYNKQASYNEQQSLIWDYFCALCLNNTSKKISKPFILQLTLLKYLILRFTSKGNLDIVTSQDTAIISFDIIQENFNVLSNPQITFTTPRVDTKMLLAQIRS